MEHELKIWKQYFDDVFEGRKTFEVRYNDRDFKTGDTLRLMEWDNLNHKFTGRECYRKVNYVFEGGHFGIMKGYVVMAIS